MDYEADERNILEHMLLDNTAAPSYLPFSLLKEITDNFSPDQQIGCGGFATVYKGQLWSGSVAVKKLHNTILMIREEKYITELECLTKVKHKNIVRFLGYCSEAHGRVLDCCGSGDLNMAEEWQRLLCFEYLPNGSLDMHISACSGRLKWRECYQIIKGICEGLYYLHQKSFLHLDLKPENILLDDNMVPKIADFGLARRFGENPVPVNTENIVGTLGYMAPEYLISTGVMTIKSDIYSLGVTIMMILTGKKEYCRIENHREMACACVLESWKRRLESSLSEDTALAQIRACAEISAACMDPDPENRPCAQDILAKLDKMETSDGFGENIESAMRVTQGIPHPAGLLHVEPLELKLRNQTGNFIPCQVYLANKTDQHVAFRLMPSDRKRESCSLELLVYGGVVPPRSTCTLNLRTCNIEKASSWKEEYLLQSRIMRNVIDFKDLRGQVHEVTMSADYILERQILKVVLKVVTCKICKVSVIGIICKVKGVGSLTYDDEKNLLTVVGSVDVAEVVAALRKSKLPVEVLSVTSNNTDGGVENDDAGRSRACLPDALHSVIN